MLNSRVTWTKICLISAAVLSYVAVLVLAGLSSREKSKTIFSRHIGEVSMKYHTEVTPSSSTFSIWGFIYFYQCLWLVYLLTIICRKRAADILPAEFFILFVVSNIGTIGWLLVWSREQLTTAFIMLSLSGIALMGCVYYACVSLFNYITHTADQEIVIVDVLCHRALVINGLLFSLAWISIAAIINFTIVLQYSMNIRPANSALISLTFLACSVTVWFGIENLTVEKYTRYFFVHYIVLLAGIGGMMSKQWIDGGGNQSFILCIFILVGIFMALRIVIMFMKERVRTLGQNYFVIAV